MKWDGIRDDTTDVSDPGETDDALLENGSFRTAGEFSRRPGFGARIANAGIVCAEINGYVVFIKSTGNIESEPQ